MTFGDHHRRVRNWQSAPHMDEFPVVLCAWLNKIWIGIQHQACALRLRVPRNVFAIAPLAMQGLRLRTGRVSSARQPAWDRPRNRVTVFFEIYNVSGGQQSKMIKIKYIGGGGGFGAVDIILGPPVLESRRKATWMRRSSRVASCLDIHTYHAILCIGCCCFILFASLFLPGSMTRSC